MPRISFSKVDHLVQIQLEALVLSSRTDLILGQSGQAADFKVSQLGSSPCFFCFGIF
jgi:hypothetical protein